jgi:hypothetical protein
MIRYCRCLLLPLLVLGLPTVGNHTTSEMERIVPLYQQRASVIKPS